MKTQSPSSKRQSADADRRRLHLLAALAIALLVAAVAASSGPTSFTTNDEAYVAQALAGSFADRPMVWVPFLSPVLTRGLYLLYSAVPGIAWYGWLQRALTFVAMAVICYCAYRQIAGRFPGREMLVGSVVGIVECGLIGWGTTRMDMRYTAAFTGSAAVCLLLTGELENRRGIFRWALSLLLFFFSVSFAPLMSAGLYALLLLIAVYKLASRRRGGGRRPAAALRVASLVLAMGLCLGGTLALCLREQSRLCDGRYAQWSSLRASYSLSAHPDYSENKKLYRAAGWNEDYSALATGNYFMDSGFDADAVSAVLKGRVGPGRLATLRGPVERAGASPKVATPLLGLSLATHGLLLACLALGFMGNKRPRGLLFIALYVALADGVWIVLRGRWGLGFPEAVSLYLPCVFATMSVALERFCRLAKSNGGTAARGRLYWRRRRLGALLALVGVIAAWVGGGMYKASAKAELPVAAVQSAYADDRAREIALEDYASGHRDRKVVCDWSAILTFDPFRALAPGQLSNLFCWDSAFRYGYSYNEQLRINGLDAPLDSRDLAREDVRFVSRSEKNLKTLLSFLSARYDLSACVVEEELEGGLMVARYQADFDIDRVEMGDELPVRVLVCEDSEVKDYRAVSFETDADSAAKRWLGVDEFMVCYHLFDEAGTDDRVTRITYDVMTPTLSVKKLGYAMPGKRFAGWKAYWLNTQSWRVEKDEDEIGWAHTLTGEETFSLFRSGRKMQRTIPAGDVLHLYAQWEDEE